MTTVLYFVSALVMLNHTPSHGWVQYGTPQIGGGGPKTV